MMLVTSGVLFIHGIFDHVPCAAVLAASLLSGLKGIQVWERLTNRPKKVVGTSIFHQILFHGH